MLENIELNFLYIYSLFIVLPFHIPYTQLTSTSVPFFTFITIQFFATSAQIYHNQILLLPITGYTENRICKIISSTPKFNDSRDVLIMPK